MISRASDILRTLGQNTGGLSLGQIAVQVKLPRSTVQRIVSALALEGLVSTKMGSGGIRLGPEIQSLAQAALTDTAERLRPMMKSISEDTGETVDLAILEGSQMLFVDQIVGSHRLRTVSSIGETFPLTTTANGKAALSCMNSTKIVKLILAELEETGRTEVSVADLLNEIEAVRKGKLAIDENEHTDGVCALGFPIQDTNGDIFALSVPVPGSRYVRIKADLSRVLLEWREKIVA